MTLYSLDILLSLFRTDLLFHVWFYLFHVASWPAYRFLKRQVRWSGIPTSWRISHSLLRSSAFSKTSLNIRKFTVHVLMKPGLENVEHYFPRVWDECNCAVVSVLFGIAFLWDWNENWPFPVLWPLLSFPNLLAYWGQHFHSIIFQDLKELHWNSITSTSFVCSDAF